MGFSVFKDVFLVGMFVISAAQKVGRILDTRVGGESDYC